MSEKKNMEEEGGVGEAGQWQGESQRWGKPVEYSVIGIKGWECLKSRNVTKCYKC